MFRPSKGTKYKHIDGLFTDTIDWDLIENHIPDLLRIVLSIKTGRVSASTILRTLGTYSRQKKLYSAFFVKWIRFAADGVILENDRDQQRKLIKDNDLVANRAILHNGCTLTRLYSQFAKEAYTFDEATIGQISPYIREHIKRFGDYLLNMDREQPLPTCDFGSKNKKFANAS
jgi:hypothetical protein